MASFNMACTFLPPVEVQCLYQTLVLHTGRKKDIPSLLLGGVCRVCVKIPVLIQPYTTLGVSFTEINQ